MIVGIYARCNPCVLAVSYVTEGVDDNVAQRWLFVSVAHWLTYTTSIGAVLPGLRIVPRPCKASLLETVCVRFSGPRCILLAYNAQHPVDLEIRRWSQALPYSNV